MAGTTVHAGQAHAGPETGGQAMARARYVRMSASKARRVVNLVRGLPTAEADAILRFAPQLAAEPVRKALLSAVANADHNDNLDRNALWVSEAYVDEGPTYKRIRPRAMGRAFRVRKRTCHITIVVAERPAAAAAAQGKAAAAATRKETTAPKSSNDTSATTPRARRGQTKGGTR